MVSGKLYDGMIDLDCVCNMLLECIPVTMIRKYFEHGLKAKTEATNEKDHSTLISFSLALDTEE